MEEQKLSHDKVRQKIWRNKHLAIAKVRQKYRGTKAKP